MRRLLPWLPPLIALVAVGLALAPEATPAEPRKPGPLVNAATERAIEMGTRYLMRIQNPDGSWPSDAGKKINESYSRFKDADNRELRNVPHVGVTSLALLSLLAGGHAPGRGPYGQAMDRGVDFILTQVQPSGYIAGHGTRMYSHAFATLALAEIYGVSRKVRVRNYLQEAVEFTVKAQNSTGGWRYVPLTNDSDMSVTVCQVVALRAARNVGIKVPRKTIDRALRYVIQSAITKGDRGPTGAFWYQPHDQKFNRPSFALCAAGLTTLFQAGLYDDEAVKQHIRDHKVDKKIPPSIERSVQYMRSEYVRIWTSRREHYFYYYGNYYAAQAMYQIGGKDPKAWADWYRMVRDHLLQMRKVARNATTGHSEAHWRSNVDTTNAYATACALLILQFPLDHLPIHQR